MNHVYPVEDEARVLGIVIVNWKKFEQWSRGKSEVLSGKIGRLAGSA